MVEEHLGKDDDQKVPWRVLEFYSGIGGMRYSLLKTGVNVNVVEAFDINDTANDVYQHNFAHRPSQGNIQTLTSTELDNFKADAWLMSPPCQPYTRQGLQKHSADSRAFSFIKIVELIPHMLHPPSMLFVENVVGFETSDTHTLLMKILAANNFSTQEFILSPIQFGIPYSRPRYFCLAKREPLSFSNLLFNGRLLRTAIPFLKCGKIDSEEKSCQTKDECVPIEAFLQAQNSSSCLPDNGEADVTLEPKSESSCVCRKEDGASSSQHLDNVDNGTFLSCSLDEYSVPFNIIDRWGNAMDIVFPDSKKCCCFTKSYYRYIKGTGSLLATVQPTDQSEFPSLKELGLRYFTPREVANLHSFPNNFNFPGHISLRQRYALLGNSLSVAVVAPLLEYLFTGGENSGSKQA